MDDEPKSVAVGILEALAYGDTHIGEDVCLNETGHLREFIHADGRLPCFLRELARYIEKKERQARKDRL